MQFGAYKPLPHVSYKTCGPHMSTSPAKGLGLRAFLRKRCIAVKLFSWKWRAQREGCRREQPGGRPESPRSVRATGSGTCSAGGFFRDVGGETLAGLGYDYAWHWRSWDRRL